MRLEEICFCAVLRRRKFVGLLLFEARKAKISQIRTYPSEVVEKYLRFGVFLDNSGKVLKICMSLTAGH